MRTRKFNEIRPDHSGLICIREVEFSDKRNDAVNVHVELVRNSTDIPLGRSHFDQYLSRNLFHSSRW